MTRITVLGGTGYAGGHIVREAAARGHEVTSVSRTLPEDRVEGVTYRAGESFISGEDFAIAFLDEIENPAHRRARFTVGY